MSVQLCSTAAAPRKLASICACLPNLKCSKSHAGSPSRSRQQMQCDMACAGGVKQASHLLKYDSTLGKFNAKIEYALPA